MKVAVMIRFLIAGLLLASFSHGEKVKLDADSNKYDSVIRALEELKAQEPAEEDESYNYPNPNQVASSDHNDSDPLKHLNMRSEAEKTVTVKFFLYTRKNLLEPQEILFMKTDTIKNSTINPKVPLKFIIHGFGGWYSMTWVQNMKSAFLEKEDLNVIVVDWSSAAKMPNYLRAAKSVEAVGAKVAACFVLLNHFLGVHEKDLHVIGFSLGAHVAGFVGKKMKNFLQTRPGRITGLDPAGPFFEDLGSDEHLYEDDADYVDVVHTNADDQKHLGLGMRKSIGHRDFYPNGGMRQPGCRSTLVSVVTDMFNKGKREAVCNHQRAVRLFIESILNNSSCEFTAYPCSDYSKFKSGGCMRCEGECVRMGYYSQGVGSFGNYYLLTTKEKPYFVAGLSKLTIKIASSGEQSMGTLTFTFILKSGQREFVAMKTDNFVPGDIKTLVIPISNVLDDLSHVLVLYQKYKDSLYPMSTPTYSLSSVTIQNPKGEFVYASCRYDPLILEDNKLYKLKENNPMEC